MPPILPPIDGHYYQYDLFWIVKQIKELDAELEGINNSIADIVSKIVGITIANQIEKVVVIPTLESSNHPAVPNTGLTDVTETLKICIQYAHDNNLPIWLAEGTYSVSGIDFQDVSVFGMGTIKRIEGDCTWEGNTLYVKGITFDGNSVENPNWVSISGNENQVVITHKNGSGTITGSGTSYQIVSEDGEIQGNTGSILTKANSLNVDANNVTGYVALEITPSEAGHLYIKSQGPYNEQPVNILLDTVSNLKNNIENVNSRLVLATANCVGQINQFDMNSIIEFDQKRRSDLEKTEAVTIFCCEMSSYPRAPLPMRWESDKYPYGYHFNGAVNNGFPQNPPRLYGNGFISAIPLRDTNGGIFLSQTTGYETRSYAFGKITALATTVSLYSIHPNPDHLNTAEQIQELADIIQSDTSAVIIIGGDFNYLQTQPGFEETFKPLTDMGFLFSNNGDIHTFPASNPVQGNENMLYKGCTLINAYTSPVTVSDHLSLVCVFERS